MSPYLALHQCSHCIKFHKKGRFNYWLPGSLSTLSQILACPAYSYLLVLEQHLPKQVTRKNSENKRLQKLRVQTRLELLAKKDILARLGAKVMGMSQQGMGTHCQALLGRALHPFNCHEFSFQEWFTVEESHMRPCFQDQAATVNLYVAQQNCAESSLLPAMSWTASPQLKTTVKHAFGSDFNFVTVTEQAMNEHEKSRTLQSVSLCGRGGTTG